MADLTHDLAKAERGFLDYQGHYTVGQAMRLHEGQICGVVCMRAGLPGCTRAVLTEIGCAYLGQIERHDWSKLYS